MQQPQRNMLLVNQILPTLVPAGERAINVYAKKQTAGVNNANIEYRVNGGSYISVGLCDSTICALIGTTDPIASGSTIDIRLSSGEMYALIENSTTCSSATGSWDIYTFTLPAGSTTYRIALDLQGLA